MSEPRDVNDPGPGPALLLLGTLLALAAGGIYELCIGKVTTGLALLLPGGGFLALFVAAGIGWMIRGGGR